MNLFFTGSQAPVRLCEPKTSTALMVVLVSRRMDRMAGGPPHLISCVLPPVRAGYCNIRHQAHTESLPPSTDSRRGGRSL